MTKNRPPYIIQRKDAAYIGGRLVTSSRREVGQYVLDADVPYLRLFGLDTDPKAEKQKPPLGQVTVSVGRKTR